jgi:hypothetical protein
VPTSHHLRRRDPIELPQIDIKRPPDGYDSKNARARARTRTPRSVMWSKRTKSPPPPIEVPLNQTSGDDAEEQAVTPVDFKLSDVFLIDRTDMCDLTGHCTRPAEDLEDESQHRWTRCLVVGGLLGVALLAGIGVVVVVRKLDNLEVITRTSADLILCTSITNSRRARHH